jgi:hypothetical protein
MVYHRQHGVRDGHQSLCFGIFEGSEDCDTFWSVCMGDNDHFCDVQLAYSWFAREGVK